MSGAENRESIDITGDICPMTFVKTKLKLEKMKPGELLEVMLCEGEPLSNLPRSVIQEGHRVVSITRQQGRQHKIIIERC